MNPGAAWRSPAVWLLGLAAIATGIVNLIFRNFDPAEEPIQAFGDHVPAQVAFACIVAVLLILGGAAILSNRSARFGAIVLAVVYGIFGVFWLPRFYWVTKFYGLNVTHLIGVLGGLCQEVIIIVATTLVYVVARDTVPPRRFALAARWIFGICAAAFGLTQFAPVRATAALVPAWIPLGGDFWAIATGIFFILAGVAIVSGMLDVLAARLLAIMLFVFSVLALAPLLFAYPHDHGAWGTNVYNLAAVAAAWIFSDWLRAQRRSYASASSASMSGQPV